MNTLKIATIAALIGVAGVAYAQTTSDVTVRIVAPTSVAVGTAQKIATIELVASKDVSIAALPVTAAGNVSNCTLRDTSGTALDGFSFAQPIPVTANQVYDIAYTCNITGNGSVRVSVDPASIVASSTSGTATVGSATSGNPSATVALGSGSTSTTPGVPNTGSNPSGTTTPGIPNTGEGGQAPMTVAVLSLAALVAIGAGYYTFRNVRA